MAMQDMVKCVGTEDVFFDSVDHHLSSEHDSADVRNAALGYEFWQNEPKSVKERRDTFLREMGFAEPCSLSEFNTDAAADAEDAEVAEDEDVSSEMRLEERSEAVSNACSSSSSIEEENVMFTVREWNGNNNDSLNVDECEDDQLVRESSVSKNHKSMNKRIRHWWKNMMKKQRKIIGGSKCKVDNEELKRFEMSRTKVQVNDKKFKELSALYEAQEIQAHTGIIWTMKFSPNGQYIATGGEDGVVRVWSIKSVDSCLEKFADESSLKTDDRTYFRSDKNVNIPIVIPDKMFEIEQFPVHEYHGHAADVLDLAWSNSNFLLSSSMDKTVRLWQIGSDACLNTFHHTDYVTCVQFNPVDNSYFISGSIDGKVRVWGVSKKRVLDWADIREAVTALCYQPDGQAFVVGTLKGSCQFYEAKGELFELSKHIRLQSSNRSFTSRITGIQFSAEDSQRVMIMSEDSKLRILEKTDVVCKFRGLPKSGSQMSASFTSNERHIVSIGQDSNVYIWNHEKPILLSSSKHTKSNRSCEHFYCEGVTVAVPWCGTELPRKVSAGSCSINHDSACIAQDPPSFSLSNMFSSKSSATWPEDMLPVFDQPEEQCEGRNNVIARSHPTWGLVIVTANRDGMIRTFHNYGFPVRS